MFLTPGGRVFLTPGGRVFFTPGGRVFAHMMLGDVMLSLYTR